MRDQYLRQCETGNALQSYLPAEAFKAGILLIDFRNWILEQALVFDSTFECIVVFGETEYPISFDLVEIDSIIDLEDYFLILKKTMDTEGQEIEVFGSYNLKEKPATVSKMELRANAFAKKNPEGMAHSLSKLTLLKPGQE